jgi:hypothetical protein
MNLLKDVAVVYGHAAVANANNTDVTTVIVDMAGYEGVMCIQPITDSANTGKAELIARQNSANSTVGMAALSGATATKTDAGGDALNSKCLVLDVHQPQERYVDFNIKSSVANVAFGDAIIILYNGAKKPVVQSSDVLHGVLVVSPAEA